MQFIHPLWLLGLLAVAIPVIIHLFNFRRYRKYYFTNLKFLKSIKKETKKQQRLRHLLILLSRIGAIVFIVLAFSRPYFPGPQGVSRSESAFVSVYVDNSMSMQAISSGHTMLDEAIATARNVADAHNTSDRFQLITNDFEGRHQSWYNKDEFLSLLDNVRISPRTRTTGEVSERMKEQSESVTQVKPRLYIISDFQKSTTQLEPLLEDTSRLVFLVPLMQDQLSNVYIDSCWMSSPFNHIGQHQEVNVRIFNASEMLLEKIPVRLKINGEQRAIASVNIEANTYSDIRLPFTNRQAGRFTGSLEIDDYPISWDDKMYVSWDVKDRIPVMVIGESETAYYLDAIFSNDSVFNYDKANIRKLVYSDFPAMDLIVLDQLKKMSSGLTAELQGFVQNGGSVLLIPGEETDLASINLLMDALGAGVLLPPDTTVLQVTALNSTHELFYDVFESIPENIDLPLVRKHFPQQNYHASSTDMIMELQNTEAFVTMTRYGKGRVYVVSSPMDEQSSNLPQHAIWVPMVYRMAMLSRPQDNLYYVMGENLEIEAPNAIITGDKSFQMKFIGGDYEFIPGYRGKGTTAQLFLYDQVNKAGHYMLSSSDQEIGIFAFNYDRAESDPALTSKALIEEELEPFQKRHVFLMLADEKPVSQYIEEFDRGRELWKMCIWIALSFIFIEIFLLRFWK